MNISVAESIATSRATKRQMDTRTVEQVTQTLIDYRGKTPPKSRAGVKLITAKVIKGGRIWEGEHEYVTEETYAVWMTRGFPQQGDILITTEAPLGEVARLRTSERVALAQRVILLRGNTEEIDQTYYFYALQSPFVQAELAKRATGTTVLGIKQSELRQVQLPYPPLATQRKIAAILSAYDDLIENNTRRIAILESMAQMLYREWFVHFRFPGHAAYKMIDSPLGPIPEGWEIVQMNDVATVYRGRSYRGTEIVDEGGLPFLNLKCIERDGGFRVDGLKRYQGQYKPDQTARAGDIVMAVTDMTQERRIVARAARVPNMAEAMFVFSMDLVKIAPHEGIQGSYLYNTLLYTSFPHEVKQHANGANVLHLNPERIESFRFALASADLRAKFDVIADPVNAEIDTLRMKNANLRRTRDLLLPKLISGEVDVEDVAIETTELEGATA